MAEVLESYEFYRKDYPWSTWLDGQIYRLSRGTDFACSAQSLKRGAVADAMNAALHQNLTIANAEKLTAELENRGWSFA